MTIDVIGIDAMPVLDILLQIPRIPATNGMTFSTEQSWQGGGKVATAMVASARLGASAGIVGIVGNDAPGRFIRDDFVYHGVDVRHLHLSEGETIFSIVLAEAETQGRSFIGTAAKRLPLEESALDWEYLRQAKYLHLSRMAATEIAAARFAKENGITVVFDADHYEESIFENMDLIDVFIASEFYLPAGAGPEAYEQVCRDLMARGPRIVVITLGAKGCIGVSECGPYFEVPAFTCFPVVDTTGAGDVFHGAYIAALLRGMDAQECARFSNAVSAIKCAFPGGRSGIPDYAIVRRFLDEGVASLEALEERRARYARCPF